MSSRIIGPFTSCGAQSTCRPLRKKRDPSVRASSFALDKWLKVYERLSEQSGRKKTKKYEKSGGGFNLCSLNFQSLSCVLPKVNSLYSRHVLFVLPVLIQLKGTPVLPALLTSQPPPWVTQIAPRKPFRYE